MDTQIPEGQNELDKQIVQAKRQFEKLMLQFDHFLKDKTLPENKSRGQLNSDSDFIERLFSSASNLDAVNSPEGTYGLIALLIREGIVMRDNYNRLEYELRETNKKIVKLETHLADRNRVGQ